MKFKKLIFSTLIGVLTMTLTACSDDNDTSDTDVTTDATNLETDTTETHTVGTPFPASDMSKYHIEGEHRFFDVTMYEALQLLEDETFDGIIYFGFYTCPWCQVAVPVMHEASQQTNTDIFYVDRHGDLRVGDWLEWDAEMAWWLNEQIELRWIYEEVDEDAEEDVEPEPIRPNIFVPQIVHLRNGVIVEEHGGTFEGHDREEDGSLPELTAEEHATLLEAYIRIFSGVNEPQVCSSDDTDTESCS